MKDTIVTRNIYEATKISKQHQITVVTLQGEVIYQGSYKAKLGEYNQNNSKLLDFLEIQQTQKEINKIQNKTNAQRSKPRQGKEKDILTSL